VIGGLISSTVLTLIVLPTLYNLVEGAKERRRARKAGSGDDGTEPVDGTEPSDGPAPSEGLALAGGGGAGSDLPHASQLTRRELRERGE
jgi:HAE1 family hydrophobic/amphiphilic exporter-1